VFLLNFPYESHDVSLEAKPPPSRISFAIFHYLRGVLLTSTRVSVALHPEDILEKHSRWEITCDYRNWSADTAPVGLQTTSPEK
jgi:hypothetical protein